MPITKHSLRCTPLFARLATLLACSLAASLAGATACAKKKAPDVGGDSGVKFSLQRDTSGMIHPLQRIAGSEASYTKFLTGHTRGKFTEGIPLLVCGVDGDISPEVLKVVGEAASKSLESWLNAITHYAGPKKNVVTLFPPADRCDALFSGSEKNVFYKTTIPKVRVFSEKKCYVAKMGTTALWQFSHTEEFFSIDVPPEWQAAYTTNPQKQKDLAKWLSAKTLSPWGRLFGVGSAVRKENGQIATGQRETVMENIIENSTVTQVLLLDDDKAAINASWSLSNKTTHTDQSDRSACGEGYMNVDVKNATTQKVYISCVYIGTKSPDENSKTIVNENYTNVF